MEQYEIRVVLAVARPGGGFVFRGGTELPWAFLHAAVDTRSVAAGLLFEATGVGPGWVHVRQAGFHELAGKLFVLYFAALPAEVHLLGDHVWLSTHEVLNSEDVCDTSRRLTLLSLGLQE